MIIFTPVVLSPVLLIGEQGKDNIESKVKKES